MYFSVLPNWAAPVTTGHPFGLPEAGMRGKSTARVPTVSEQPSSDTGFMQEKSPTRYRRAAGEPPEPENHCPPPSILQLRISAMLEEQAEAQARTHPGTDEGDHALDIMDPVATAQAGRESQRTGPATGFGRLPETCGCARRRLEKILA